MIYVRLVVILGWMAAVWTSVLPVSGADFSLRVVGVDSQRRPTLSLSGLMTGRYGLEASTNLSQWFSVTSAPAGIDPVSFVHSEAVQLGTVFYRAVQIVEAGAIVPQVDSNRVAVGLITMANGGSLVLTNESGVRYTFTVAPSNVLDTVAVRMTLVTNFASFPYENEVRTAVLFEPSGFEFHGAGLLDILYPTNVPYLKISSFAFNGDGGGFHLTPDVVSSNRVQIPVTHFSGVGNGLWSPTERTKAVNALVENRMDRIRQDMAGILGRERDNVLAGGEETPLSALNSELESRQKDYYDNYLKPFFAEAEKDCALALTLSRQILGMERQGALLGVPGPADSILGSATLAKWNCNCVAEAINACKEGKISDKTLIRTLIGAERQAQLLGGGDVLEGCGLGSLNTFMEQALNQKLPCAPDWIGTISYSDGGSRSWDCSGSPGVTCTASSSAALTFEADVERATLQDDSFPPFFSRQTWTLKLFPTASGSFSSDSHSVHRLDCGGTVTTTHRKSGANSGPLDLEAVFVFENGELTDFNIYSVVHGELGVKTIETATGVTTPCEGGGQGSSSSNIFHDTVFLDPEGVNIDEVAFTKQTPVALEGTARATRIGVNGITMPFSWTFSLRRNGSGAAP